MLVVKKNKFASNFGVLFLLIVLSACGNDYYYDAEVSIPEDLWDSKKAIVFQPTISDTMQNYNVILSVSNKDDYRYSNIWFFISTISPEGYMHTDTLEYLMAEDDGKWTGDKDGEIWTRKLYFKNQVRFPKPGKYKFSIIQGMRDTLLEGISGVGIHFEEININHN